MKQKAIVLDLDGTLCDLNPESEKNNHTWDEKAIDFMYDIYLSAWASHRIIVLTGRKEKYRVITAKWLLDNDYHIDELIMQKGSMAQKNHIFKEQELVKLQEIYDIRFMIDDNPEMQEVCKRLWIPLLLLSR